MLRLFAVSAFLAMSLSVSMAQAPASSDPPANLYLVALPGQIVLVNKFNTVSSCKVAQTNWSFNQLAGVQANTVNGAWVALVCVPIQ
jgi:hypothetical protein